MFRKERFVSVLISLFFVCIEAQAGPGVDQIGTMGKESITPQNPISETLEKSQAAGQGIPIERACPALPSILPEDRTADRPDSWLVLYNLSVPESVEWADFFKRAHCIPDEHVLGINAWPNEYLHGYNLLVENIILPTVSYLNTHPDIKEKVMGIVLGYAMPGKYCDWFNAQGGCNYQPVGSGLSVSNALQDLSDVDSEISSGRAQYHVNSQLINFNGSTMRPRLTKATLSPNHYLVTRIDAPTLAIAKNLTVRQKQITNPDHYIHDEIIWYDYADAQMGNWGDLRSVAPGGGLNEFFSEAIWQPFNSDTESTHGQAAFRFDWHDTTNWNNGRLVDVGEPGSKILAYNKNSWGAVTLRSSSAGSRFVPNAIENGWAAAIGSTTEPLFLPLTPKPANLLACLKAGWTIAEAMYLSNPYDDHTWELIADPFLKVPHWFDESE